MHVADTAAARLPSRTVGVLAPARPDDEASWLAFRDRAREIQAVDPLAPATVPTAPRSYAVRRLRVAGIDQLPPGVASAARDLEAAFAPAAGAAGGIGAHRGGGDVIVSVSVRDPDSARRRTLPPGGGFSIGIQRGPASERVVRIDAATVLDAQRAIARVQELAGYRFLSYRDTYEPKRADRSLPGPGYSEHRPPPRFSLRGFAPHTYHPIPLSMAFHEPTEAGFRHVAQYIDWLVRTGQNHVMFPALELDGRSRFLPIVDDDRPRFKAWLPHARRILDYAHERGVSVSIKLAFANYVSANAFAINPVAAAAQSAHLGLLRATGSAAAYGARLAQYAASGAERIARTIDAYMQVPWDEIAWNLGTSEFTPTNDDLTVRWMDAAARHAAARHPDVRITARSHVPGGPWSERYGDSYFNLTRFADQRVGQYIHTTHSYALTDPAPVYGVDNFEHKLRSVHRATTERLDVYYPETSYWVNHDVTVPLFLPVYAANRKRDLDVVRGVRELDGHVGFTTAWEWGYWLNDYLLAAMQERPEVPLPVLLREALAPLGGARVDRAAQLVEQTARLQQQYLVERGLIRHLQGFEPLTELGATASRTWPLRELLHGANATPVRTSAAQIARMDDAQLKAFVASDLEPLAQFERALEAVTSQWDEIERTTPAGAHRYAAELADATRVTLERTRQVRSLIEAVVAARRVQTSDRSGVGAVQREAGASRSPRALLEHAAAAQARARAIIDRREGAYRDPPQWTWAEANGPTMWPNRALTKVHTMEYWRRSREEAERVLRRLGA